ncbi:MAG: lysylphosphatidylglycerol synthase transmembrane domain-containing protein [Phycisphaerae bacterium]
MNADRSKKKRTRKILLFTLKFIVAAVLIAWVLTRVHWSTYVVTSDGEGHTIIERVESDGRVESYRVASGPIWDRTERTIPADDDHLVSIRRDDGERATQAPPRMRYEWPGFIQSLADISALLLSLAVVGFLMTVLVTSVRWWFLLRLQRIRLPLWEVVKLTFLGQFFNYIVPGTVGGDVVKAWCAAQRTNRKEAAMISIFTDRVLGLTEMTLLAAIMITIVLLTGMAPLESMFWPAVTTAVVTAIVVTALLLLLSRRLRRWLRFEKFYSRLPIARQLRKAGEAAALYRKRIKYLLTAVLITFVAHLFFIGAVMMIGFSLHIKAVSWFHYFIYVPLIYILGAVPISPGGVGWVEGLYQGYFSGANASKVLALAMLARLIPMFWSLPGAIVAIREVRLPKRKKIEEDLGLESDSEQAA